MATDHTSKRQINRKRPYQNSFPVWKRTSVRSSLNAINIIYEVFNECESYWRGLGKVNNAGLEIKEKYKEFDSLSKFNISFLKENDNKGCSCGEVLIGLKEPRECKLFGTVCTPLTPIGACMVSEEGTCSAYYKYK